MRARSRPARGADLPVYRTRPLPTAILQGQFFVPQEVLSVTSRALVDAALAGIHDGGHEGLVFWAGKELGNGAVFLQAIIPVADHSSQRVMASRTEVGEVARRARAQHLGILCQVHSHPSSDSRHSDGDDELVLLPFENMLSIVAPHFGLRLRLISDCSVHQFQGGRWVLCSTESVERGFTVVPAEMDLR
jgi:hypothetical protein